MRLNVASSRLTASAAHHVAATRPLHVEQEARIIRSKHAMCGDSPLSWAINRLDQIGRFRHFAVTVQVNNSYESSFGIIMHSWLTSWVRFVSTP